jgi:hypothetical protein
MIYDRTCTGRGPLPGLTHSWMAGALLYRGLGRLDAWRGVASWGEALAWLADVQLERPISEIQFWGHGKWGEARVDQEILDDSALLSSSEYAPHLRRIRARLTGEDALWWFRTCETFGATKGHAFARAWTDYFGCAGAGHTYIIGPWQSGLHRLAVGDTPTWSDEEGLAEGSAAEPRRALWSKRTSPNTISCLHGEVPEGF